MRIFLIVVLSTLLLSACGAMEPAADAGSDQYVVLGNSTTLDGTRSDQRNGDPLTYHWYLQEAPALSQGTLSDPTSPTPSFTPDVLGDYTFELEVDNGYHKNTDRVIIRCISENGPDPVEFARNDAGTIILYDLSAVENSRTAANVNFSLDYTLVSTATATTDISFTVYGSDTNGADVFTYDISASIAPDETRIVTLDLGEALTVDEFDSIDSWSASAITEP